MASQLANWRHQFLLLDMMFNWENDGSSLQYLQITSFPKIPESQILLYFGLQSFAPQLFMSQKCGCVGASLLLRSKHRRFLLNSMEGRR